MEAKTQDRGWEVAADDILGQLAFVSQEGKDLDWEDAQGHLDEAWGNLFKLFGELGLVDPDQEV